jgi:hypothetical protein
MALHRLPILALLVEARASAARNILFLVLPDDVPAHPYAVAMETVHLAPKAEVSI